MIAGHIRITRCSGQVYLSCLAAIAISCCTACIGRNEKLFIPYGEDQCVGVVMQRSDSITFEVVKDGSRASNTVSLMSVPYLKIRDGDYTIVSVGNSGKTFVLLDAAKRHFANLPNEDDADGWKAAIVASAALAKIEHEPDTITVDANGASLGEVVPVDDGNNNNILTWVHTFDLHSDVTAESIGKLRKLPNLKTLIVGNRAVGENELKLIRTIDTIEMLNLAYCQLNIYENIASDIAAFGKVVLSMRQVESVRNEIAPLLKSERVIIVDQRFD